MTPDELREYKRLSLARARRAKRSAPGRCHESGCYLASGPRPQAVRAAPAAGPGVVPGVEGQAVSDEDALLRAILDRPDDDLPRLVLADWLDEHGEGERAEFIRVQCAIWRLGHAASWTCACDSSVGVVCEWCQDREPLQRRERTLFGAIWDRWFVLPELQSPHPSFAPITMVYDLETRRLEYHIRRGFVESVACDLRTFAGGPCENCAGFGEFRRRHDNSDGPEGPCPDCGGKWNSGPHDDTDSYWDRGTGRTPGVAPDLFARQPVTKVTLVEKKPVYSEGSKGCDARWSRQTREGDDSPWVLPPYLFDQLPHRLARYVRDNYHEYESLADSREALSAAAVAWGRSVARG